MPSQKHLRLEVPNYNHDAASTTHPYSFIQLGAAPPQAEDQGYDLLVEAGLPTDKIFKDDFRKSNTQQHPATKYFRDDGTTSTSAGAPERDYDALTNELLTRGGWRQHTDGNHISTTRGDRVDVIFGNHKMVVYGRMDCPNTDWGETYWETSGGHTRWATNTQGDMVMVQWNTDRNTWRTYEETIKGDSIERFQGIVDEIYESPTLESYVGCRAAQVGQPIPNADSDNPHEQKTQASGWVNPGTGFGGTASSASNTLGRRRKKENPDLETKIQADKIDELVKVTSGMGAAGSDAFSDLMKPTNASITAPGATATKPIHEIVNTAFGELDPSIRLPTGGWAAPLIGSGWIVETQHVKNKTYELTLATLHEEKITVDSGVTINSQTGLRPALDATGEVTDAAAARRIDHITDVGINIVQFGEDMYLHRKARGYGGWTFDLSLVAMAIDISIVGITQEYPNFPKIAETGGRHQFGLTLANTIDIGLSASIDLKLAVHLKFATKKEELDLGKNIKVGILAVVGTVKELASQITRFEMAALLGETNANHQET